MTRIQGSRDCGNSPKNKFVQDVAIALECGDISPRNFSDDVIWDHPSIGTISGMTALLKQLGGQAKPKSIVIEHAISHGKIGAASGEVTTANGHVRSFCHVIEFTSAKANCVSGVKSYA